MAREHDLTDRRVDLPAANNRGGEAQATDAQQTDAQQRRLSDDSTSRTHRSVPRLGGPEVPGNEADDAPRNAIANPVEVDTGGFQSTAPGGQHVSGAKRPSAPDGEVAPD